MALQIAGGTVQGIGGALASMISTILMVGLLAAAAYFIYRMLTRKQNGAQAFDDTGQRVEEGVAEYFARHLIFARRHLCNWLNPSKPCPTT